MSPSAPNSYLETEVLTATPQRLQLMLIDGAIRFIGRARCFWEAGDDEQASETLIRAQQIVTHLLGGLNREVDAALARRVASVYLFVFRSLVDANMNRDHKPLDEALKVLETERETWQTLCRKLATSGNDRAAETAPPPADPVACLGLPDLSSGAYPAGGMPGGLSIEA